MASIFYCTVLGFIDIKVHLGNLEIELEGFYDLEIFLL